MDEKRKMSPVHTVKLGKVQAAIWANETKHGTRFNVTASRLYQENGSWKRSDSFGRDELLPLAKALVDAYAWIWAQASTHTEDVTTED